MKNFYYHPILGLQYSTINHEDLKENTPLNRSERRKIKFKKTTYKNNFGLKRNLF